MSYRHSRNEKGKWKEDRLPPRKPLVKIPEANVSDLIDRHKLTLIGRVTNASVQKTKALVDFFLQHWSVVGRITGRDLGPYLFEFSFDSEKDLQIILSKAPFHFKRWMVILQRWEPVVSDTFPARIPFWINVHGIPLHYWTDGTIEAIGAPLGLIDARVVDKARMRVQINGLQPLVMRMDIELPSKEVVEVELEYEKLKKHCFRCKSLSHEEDDCDINPPRHHYEGDRRTNNISQQNTLERIAEGKQRQADRKQSRLQQRPYNTGARWPNYKETNSRGNRDSYREAISKNPSENSSGYEENRRRYDDRYEERNKQISRTPVYVRRSPTIRGSQGPASAINSNQARSLNGNEKNRTPPSREASSVSKSSPPANLALVPQRNSLVSRLSDPKSLSVASAERQSAKERLSVQTQRLSTSNLRDSLSGSKRQDREPHNGEDEPTKEINNFTITRPSSSSIFDSNRLGPGDRSPIRTLSDDRVHVSLRLGTLISETESEDSEPSDLPTLTKAEGKRTMLRSQSKKRGPRSPLQGTSVKKRRVTKIRESPRRKLMMDAITAGGRGLSGVSRSTPVPRGKPTTRSTTTTPRIIPATVKKRKDFHLPPKSLP